MSTNGWFRLPATNDRLFILGNGFDLDLGLKTSYKNFIDSEYWPFRNVEVDSETEFYRSYKSLGQYIINKTTCDWFDLEGILLRYAIETSTVPNTGKDYQLLCDKVSCFIEKQFNEQIGKIKLDACAAKVLKAIVENGRYDIYSFNYTDLNAEANQLGIKQDFSYEHVHGSVKEKTTILGIRDDEKIQKEYLYMLKHFNKNYTSHPIRYKLQKAKEVVFFGHSLGNVDYVYFSEFFAQQSKCESEADSKKITIFTYDEKSQMDILSQLRDMNEYQSERLINSNDFEIFMTKSIEGDLPNDRFDNFLKHVRETHPKKTSVVSVGLGGILG